MSKVIRMGHSKRKSSYDYHLAGNKPQDSVCEKNLGVNVILNQSPESHIWRIVKTKDKLSAGEYKN